MGRVQWQRGLGELARVVAEKRRKVEGGWSHRRRQDDLSAGRAGAEADDAFVKVCERKGAVEFAGR